MVVEWGTLLGEVRIPVSFYYYDDSIIPIQ
jgi:hypothetical protein